MNSLAHLLSCTALDISSTNVVVHQNNTLGQCSFLEIVMKYVLNIERVQLCSVIIDYDSISSIHTVCINCRAQQLSLENACAVTCCSQSLQRFSLVSQSGEKKRQKTKTNHDLARFSMFDASCGFLL